MVAVAVGGVLGAAAREAVAQAMPAAPGAFPWSTLVVNVSGAFVLGLLLERLVRTGDDRGWRRRLRLAGGTGFLGSYTTYSTFAVETADLARTAHVAVAVAYLAATVVAGLVATAAGIALAAGLGRGSSHPAAGPAGDRAEPGR